MLSSNFNVLKTHLFIEGNFLRNNSKYQYQIAISTASEYDALQINSRNPNPGMLHSGWLLTVMFVAVLPGKMQF
jgi:hypothetical protein